MVEHPAFDPLQLLDVWMQWEKGEMLPGLTISKLKSNGMRQVLEQLAEQARSAKQ